VFIVNGHRSDIFHLTGFPAPFEIRWEENVSLRLLTLLSGVLCLVQSIIYFHKVRWTVKRFMKFRKEYQPAINIRKFSWLKNASIFIGLLGLGLSVTIVEVSKFPFISVFLFIFMLAISSFVFLFTLHFYNLFPFEKNSTQEILAEEELIDSKRKNWLNSFTCGELYLDRNLDLEKAARLLEMPKYKLAQLIKEEGHVNFSCFVNYYRVERCKLLLENLPGCKVIDSLVEETGFQARSTFFRVFKKHTGLSPKEYLDQKNCTLVG
jgi:AraC-like DNA-binding protein